MKLLFNYLSHYRWRVIGALALAATNQIFSLMDPYIFRKIIDDVAAVYRSDTHSMDQFIAAIWPLALASVGVAFVSRVAKNFQDYVINTVTQKVGANLYSDGIRHSLELPYETFEDQRSGETLGKLQKVRVDVEKLITIGINILFQSIIALIFISVYAFSVHWMVMPLFLITGQIPRISRTRNRAFKCYDGEDPKIRIEKSTLCAFDGFCPRNLREFIAHADGGRVDLFNLRREDHDRPILFLEYLFLLPF